MGLCEFYDAKGCVEISNFGMHLNQYFKSAAYFQFEPEREKNPARTREVNMLKIVK